MPEPCPNCGGHVTLQQARWSWQEVIVCDDCGATAGAWDTVRVWVTPVLWCDWPESDLFPNVSHQRWEPVHA